MDGSRDAGVHFAPQEIGTVVATIGRLEPKPSALETRGQFAAELVGTHDGLGSLQQRGRGGGVGPR